MTRDPVAPPTRDLHHRRLMDREPGTTPGTLTASRPTKREPGTTPGTLTVSRPTKREPGATIRTRPATHGHPAKREPGATPARTEPGTRTIRTAS